MDGQARRRELLKVLSEADGAVSAATLARRFAVSRQVIVGDVALLRAGGAGISVTPRGYMLPGDSRGELYTVACRHGRADTERELCIMVDNGCTVLDVVVEHPVYGQITGALHLESRYDVGQFMARLSRGDARLLSDLTGGEHLHTLRCPDEERFLQVVEQLGREGFLAEEKH